MADLYVPLHEVEKSAEKTTVCLTGASGFVAGHVVQRLLAAGHTVHATVRDPSNEASVAALKALPFAAEGLKLFKADLLQPGAFAEAVQGCKVVVHTASPFFSGCKPEDVKAKLLDPAVNGTVNILEAVNGCASVERVVLTSSVAAIWTSNKADQTSFDESDWADSVSETDNPYALSKKMAEEKAWEIAKAQSRWKLITINPAYVMGPPIGSRLDGESIKIIADLFEGRKNDKPDQTFQIVDVRDVAVAHCLAMVHPAAHGRNICCEGKYNVVALCEFFKSKYPSVQVPEGKPLLAKPTFNNTKLPRELGLEWHSIKTCMLDMVTRLQETGRIAQKEE